MTMGIKFAGPNVVPPVPCEVTLKAKDTWKYCDGEQQEGEMWHYKPPEEQTPAAECPADPTDQNFCQCLDAGSSGELTIFKTTRKLFTLPMKDRSATVGEAINGRYVPPADGLLFVKVEGSTDDADVFVGNPVANDGWMIVGHRQGTKLDGSKCFKMLASQLLKFNLLGKRSDGTSKIKMTFDFYVLDADHCCMKHTSHAISFDVLPMPCAPEDSAKTEVWAYNHPAKNDGSVDTELEIPRCCGGNSTHSERFIAWPAVSGVQINDGFANGWTINQDTLISPSEERHKINNTANPE